MSSTCRSEVWLPSSPDELLSKIRKQIHKQNDSDCIDFVESGNSYIRCPRKCEPLFVENFLSNNNTEFIKILHRVTLEYYQHFHKVSKTVLPNLWSMDHLVVHAGYQVVHERSFHALSQPLLVFIEPIPLVRSTFVLIMVGGG